MALRCTIHHPVTSSAMNYLRPAVNIVNKPSCQHPIRAFSSHGNVYRNTFRRDMQTSTAYRPHTLPGSGVPPQNSSTQHPSNAQADTSLSADFLSPSETKARQESGQSAPSSSSSETESQKTETTAAQTSTTTQHPTQRRHKHRRPLRPRKAAMKLSPTAVEQLRKLLSQPSPKLIRVGVKNRGCSGLAYHLEYVDKPGMFDEVVEQDGVKVLIDSKALFSIIGSEMDWHEDKLSKKFVFRNPNISKCFP